MQGGVIVSDTDQRSVQENTQDLDQNQQVDVKPSQVNVQRIDVTVNTKLENYAAKITGNIYINDELFQNADISLYFGSMSSYPIYRTSSDLNGNFVIENLPPGFYALEASYRKRYYGKVMNIKLMPGENYECSIHLVMNKYSNSDDDK
jgi:hypothetical protein